MSRTIDVSDLPEPLIRAIKTIIDSYRERVRQLPAEPRSVGWARGLLPELPDSFFEPLPDELLDLFEITHD